MKKPRRLAAISQRGDDAASSSPSGSRLQFRKQLRGLSLDAQLKAVQPPDTPLQFQLIRPSSRPAEALQFSIEDQIEDGTLDEDSAHVQLLLIIERFYSDRAPSDVDAAIELIDRALDEHGMGWRLDFGDNIDNVSDGVIYHQIDGGTTFVGDRGEIRIKDSGGRVLLELPE